MNPESRIFTPEQMQPTQPGLARGIKRKKTQMESFPAQGFPEGWPFSGLELRACMCFFGSGKIHKLRGISQTDRRAEEFKGWAAGRGSTRCQAEPANKGAERERSPSGVQAPPRLVLKALRALFSR